MTSESVSPPDSRLREMLETLKAEDAGLTASERVELAVMHAWDTRHSAPARNRYHRLAWRFGLAAASLAALIVARGHWRASSAQSDSVTAPDRSATLGESAALNGSPYDAAAWLDTDPSSLQVLRVRVPGAAMTAQGYAVSDPDGDGAVEIEIVVGDDGAARSVRTVPTPETPDLY